MFNIDEDYKDNIFKELCEQRAVVIFRAESNEIIAILQGVSYKAIMDACSKSQNDYILGYLSDIPRYIRYPFLYDVITHKAGDRIRKNLKAAIESWRIEW